MVDMMDNHVCADEGCEEEITDDDLLCCNACKLAVCSSDPSCLTITKGGASWLLTTTCTATKWYKRFLLGSMPSATRRIYCYCRDRTPLYILSC